MCGIVGFFDKSDGAAGPTGGIVLAMLRALACRGPDSAGIAVIGELPEPDDGGWTVRVALAPGDGPVLDRLARLGRVVSREVCEGESLKFRLIPNPGVTADDVDSTARHLWSRSLEDERERRVTDRHAVTGGSVPTIRGHVSRDLDRELAHEMEKRVAPPVAPDTRSGDLTAEEAAWEATRLNIILANKGYSDSDVTRWWNFTRHRELGDQTIAEAWRDGRYAAVGQLIQSLPDKLPRTES